jgi:hypothetical protein
LKSGATARGAVKGRHTAEADAQGKAWWEVPVQDLTFFQMPDLWEMAPTLAAARASTSRAGTLGGAELSVTLKTRGDCAHSERAL